MQIFEAFELQNHCNENENKQLIKILILIENLSLEIFKQHIESIRFNANFAIENKLV